MRRISRAAADFLHRIERDLAKTQGAAGPPTGVTFAQMVRIVMQAAMSAYIAAGGYHSLFTASAQRSTVAMIQSA
jgi:hypothetical protein